MPTYKPADKTVATIANRLLAKFHEPLVKAEIRIDFVFAYADLDENDEPIRGSQRRTPAGYADHGREGPILLAGTGPAAGRRANAHPEGCHQRLMGVRLAETTMNLETQITALVLVLLSLVAGCAPQLDDRNTLILKFGTTEFVQVPDIANYYIVRATNGCIYFVNFSGKAPKTSLMFESK